VNFHPTTQVTVGLSFGEDLLPVGRLALRDRKIYFEYDASFLDSGLDISPLNCPAQAGVQTFDSHLFDGLPGVFNDSLPDGWGCMLLDRTMRSMSILLEELSPLDRLARVGHSGMGALIYEPDCSESAASRNLDLDAIAIQTEQVLQGKATDVLQELLLLNGSSGGVRPKVLVSVSEDRNRIACGADAVEEGFEPWIVKFSSAADGIEAGAIEYVYALMARNAGIEMEETHLFPSRTGPGYFATRRFDRKGDQRLHSHSACGLLHSDFRAPSLDYQNLVALTMVLTRDIREAEKMFRLAVFNALSHNRDDHAKNFSFLMDSTGQWELAPAYDLTFSPGPGGWQSTSVLGESQKPGIENLVALGLDAKLSKATVDAAIEQTKMALDQWRDLATQHAVPPQDIDFVESKLSDINS